MRILSALALGFVLDLLFGDPHGMPHPVVLIGKGITAAEKTLRRIFPKTDTGEFWGGVCLVAVICGMGFGVPYIALLLADRVHPMLGFVLETFWCYQILATKSLRDESMKVCTALEKDDLPAARTAVSYIVGRDTDALSAEGVAKAAVETVAENTADGIVAPMLFLALGGAPLGMLYKAINTMDSMVGYKNERYRYFGTAAARLDDIANYLPARISALLMIAAAYFVRLDAKGAWRIWRRDRYCHKSPNSAQTESVAAGALGVQLAGPAVYFGVRHEKPTIGDALRPVVADDIRKANRLLYVSASFCLVLCEIVRAVLIF